MPASSRSRTARKGFDADAYEQRIEGFLAELEEEEYRNGAGLKDDLALAPIYERHAALFARSAVDALRDRVTAGGDEADRIRALLAFATDGFLLRAVAPLTDAVATAESRAAIVWRGERIPYRAAQPRISAISDRGERNALFASWLQAVEAINPLRLDRLQQMEALVVELGYRDYVEFVAVTRGWDPDALGVSAREALVATETGYFASMRRAMAVVGIEQGDGTLADAWHVLRGAGWDGWFPARSMLPVLESTFSGLGMRLRDDGTTLDVEPRPGKESRAFCSVIRAPGDVRLVVNPHGGWEDYRTGLHEAGHLVHFANVDPALPTWARLLGDASVTEGYAMAFDALTGDADWLAAQLGMPEEEARAFCDFMALTGLHRIRRLAAMHLSELSLYRGGPDAVHRATFAGTYGLLTGVQVPDALYLFFVDDAMYRGSYLRAMMLGGAVDEAMANRHGAGWWRDATAGAELRELLGHGLGWSPERVVASLGYDALDWRPVLRKIRTQLIGEMSGYGGPNITTRAGTRKI
jgi:hypothetical protein